MCCHHKVPKLGGLKPLKFIVLQFWSTEAWNPITGRALLLLKLVGQNFSLLLTSYFCIDTTPYKLYLYMWHSIHIFVYHMYVCVDFILAEIFILSKTSLLENKRRTESQLRALAAGPCLWLWSEFLPRLASSEERLWNNVWKIPATGRADQEFAKRHEEKPQCWLGYQIGCGGVLRLTL